MKNFKELSFEEKLAGIFGVIAIIAICIEMAISGFSIESVIAGIKDFAGTVVAVLVFVIAIRGMSDNTNKNFIEHYEEEMNLLVKKYNPLLQKTEEGNTSQESQKTNKFATTECYDLDTNAGALYGDNHGRIARFCEIPKKNCKSIRFSLNYSMFGYNAKTEINQLNMQIIGQKIRGFLLNFLDTNCQALDVHSVDFDSKELDINVNFNRVLKSEQDAEMLIQIIDCVLINCLILSGREIKISNEH